MKKIIALFGLVCLSCVLMSWGFFGHKTVATIADRHLTAEAKKAITDLLGNQTIVDVSSWADEVRNQPEYKSTANWHFVNAPLGLSFKDFKDTLSNSTQGDLLKALNQNEMVIKNPDATKDQKAIALKFIIHLVGDAHQPMHVSRAEDKGGNTIQVQFDGKGTNLHTLWDSRLLDHQGLSIAQIAEKDDLSRRKIKRLQRAAPIDWLYESYQISSKLYEEIALSNKVDETYYQTHIGIANERIEMGGIRLAGLLNELFKNGITYKN